MLCSIMHTSLHLSMNQITNQLHVIYVVPNSVLAQYVAHARTHAVRVYRFTHALTINAASAILAVRSWVRVSVRDGRSPERRRKVPSQ